MPSSLLATWLLAAALGAGEDEVLIYRCTDASGHETYQDAKCPENSFQHIIRMQRPSEAPPPKPAPAPAEPAPNAPKPAAADAAEPASEEPDTPTRGFSLPPWETEESLRPPPPEPGGPQVRRVFAEVPDLPALWRCRGLDRKPYLSDTDKPPPKCIPVAELGIQLDALPKEMRGSCQNVYDACERLSDRDVCGHLRAQLAEADALGKAEDVARLTTLIDARCPLF